MDNKIDLKRRRNQAYAVALAEIRGKLAPLNAVLILLSLGIKASTFNYIVAASYFCWSLFWIGIQPLRRWAGGGFGTLLALLDLGVTVYMISQTGGSSSALYPVLFLPVLAASIRFALPGVIIWATIASLAFVAASYFAGNIYLVPTVTKIIYLYLLGLTGSYLVRKTFTASDEVSKKLARLNNDLEYLNNFSQEVTGSSDLEAIYAHTIKAVLKNNPNATVAIGMFYDEGELKIMDSAGWEPSWLEQYDNHPLHRESISLAHILVFKKPLFCIDINKHHELVRTFDGIPVTSLFAFPLVVDLEVAGALLITSAERYNMPEPEIQIMASIANQAGIAIQNVVSLFEVKQKADTDGLTGLYNRRYFNEQIEELVNQAKRHDQQLSLIMMDVDNFKKYNDTYGHPAGDQLLKVVAQVLTEAVRDGDIVARYGGEEFSVILRNTGREMALAIAERIRAAVAGIPEAKLRCPITVSVGVGILPDQGSDRAELIEYADKSLYHAKQNGKNQVCCGFDLKNSIKQRSYK